MNTPSAFEQQSGFETRIPVWQGEDPWIYVQHHGVYLMPEAHWHSHVELNLLEEASVTYVSAGRRVSVPEGRLALFWAPIPHQVVEAEGKGRIHCVYVSLQEFMRWNLPVRFRHEIMHGGFLVATERDDADLLALPRWYQDARTGDPRRVRQALDEIQVRLRRMALTGWHGRRQDQVPEQGGSPALSRGIAHVEAMATYIAEHYHERVTVAQIADRVGLHPNYAMTLFKQVIGLPIAVYLTHHRLSHAQAMLADTDEKILAVALECGFSSLSRFYEAFGKRFDMTPRQYREEWRRRMDQAQQSAG